MLHVANSNLMTDDGLTGHNLTMTVSCLHCTHPHTGTGILVYAITAGLLDVNDEMMTQIGLVGVAGE